jgi:hypothetical protein
MHGLAGVWEELQRRGAVQEFPAQLTREPALLEYHSSVIRSSGELFTKHPCGWQKLRHGLKSLILLDLCPS